jgi:hypothetical protein
VVLDLQDTRFFFIYGIVLHRFMLLYIFSDSFMGLRFATMILKAGKLDTCELIGLMVAALNFVSGLRYVEDHRLPCSFGRKRCVRTFGFGQDYLGMIAWS